MLRWFKPIPFYLRVYRDRMILRRIDNGQELDRMAPCPFTTQRLLIGNFPEASDLLNTMMKEIIERIGFLSRGAQLVVHPMEMTDGGLSAVEMRAFTDLGEFSGAKPVVIVLDQEALNDAQVFKTLMGSSRSQP